MSDFKLEPCPNCQHENFNYGFDTVTFIGQYFEKPSINSDTPSPRKNFSKIIDNSPAKFIGGFIGQSIRIYSFAKQVLFDKIKTTPLLICEHCKNHIVVCPHCKQISLIERQPKRDEYIECINCKGGFLLSEYGNLPPGV